jgi:hypothetical protein
VASAKTVRLLVRAEAELLPEPAAVARAWSDQPDAEPSVDPPIGLAATRTDWYPPESWTVMRNPNWRRCMA